MVNLTFNTFENIAERRYTFLILRGSHKSELLFYIRAKVFFEEQDYSLNEIDIEDEKEALHILALKNNRPVGTVTIFFENGNKLPVEKFVDLSRYKAKDEKNMYFSKLAVLKEERKKLVGYNLILLTNEIAKMKKIKKVFLGAKSENMESIHLFKKTGCREISRFIDPGVGEIVLFMIDVENESIFQINQKSSFRKEKIIKHYFPNLEEDLKKLFV